jgi:acyl-CoA synthetase (NDP forming)
VISDDIWQYLFNPRSVAVIGASNNPGSWGERITRHLLAPRNRPIYAVNPKSSEVLGLTTYKSITMVPDTVELAVIVVRAELVATALRECAQKKVKAALIISGGFRETGKDGAKLEAEIVDIARRGGIRFIGPNTMGHLDTSSQLNAISFIEKMPPGPVALLAQSGNMGTRIMNNAMRYGIGFRRFVCCGNEADIFLEDYLEYFARDPNINVIMLYIEGLREARRFLKLARQITITKPIVAMKSGRTQGAAKASRSHVGALTGSDSAYSAAFKQAGVIRVENDDELCDVTFALLNQPLPRGKKVGILTMGGGLGVVAAEACEGEGLELVELELSTIQKLDALLPARWSHGNPVDLVGSNIAHSADITSTLWILMEDKNPDAVISNTLLGRMNRDPHFSPEASNPDSTRETEEDNVRQFQQRVKKYGIPFLMVGSPPQFPGELSAYAFYHKMGLPIYTQPQQAARTLRYLNWYRNYLETIER